MKPLTQFVTILAFAFIPLSLKSKANLYLTVTLETGIPIQGLGVELDPHFLSQNVAANNGTRAEDWERIILRRLEMLHFQKLRVMILPEWYEPENDNDNPDITNRNNLTFTSPEMNSLYKVLDFAEQKKIAVTLTFWGARPKTFLFTKNAEGWLFGPDQYEEWAENLSACLKHLLKDKKYTCIHEVTPVNEPDWSFSKDSVDQAEQYIRMCRILDKRLRKDRLRKLVKLNLSDNSDGGYGTHAFLEKCTAGLGNIADIFNSHTYIFGYETPNSRIKEWEAKNVELAAAAGKKHFIGEFGSNQTAGSTRQRDIDNYERGVLMARIVINLLNAGAAGASYWSLLDQYYSKEEALKHRNMQQLGLWRYLKKEYANDSIYAFLKEDYQVRPQYYAFGLLGNTVERGDRIYPLETGNDFIAATAIRKGKGRWAYLIANATNETIKIFIRNLWQQRKPTFDIYLYTSSALPDGDSLLKPVGKAILRKGIIETDVPPHSVCALRQR